MQSELGAFVVRRINIARNKAQGVEAEADGESYRLDKVGRASAVRTEADGLAIAKGLEAQQLAVGKDQTAVINVVRALADGSQRFVPENLALTLGGDAGLGGNLNALVPLLMRWLQRGEGAAPAEPAALRRRSPTARIHRKQKSTLIAGRRAGVDPLPVIKCARQRALICPGRRLSEKWQKRRQPIRGRLRCLRQRAA